MHGGWRGKCREVRKAGGFARWGRRPPAARRYRRLTIEGLEDRRVLSADWNPLGPSLDGPAGGVLTSTGDYRSDALLVQFRPGSESPGSLAAHLLGGRVGEEWSLTPGLRRVELPPGVDVQTAIGLYQGDPNVLYAEPDYRVQLQLEPNDPLFWNQWDLHNTGQNGGIFDVDIDAPEAWDVTTGSDSVIVAVIDTGIDYRHPDLAANIWTNPGEIPGNGIDDDRNGYVDDVHGYDFANRDGDPMDDHFHGTHVAGTIGAVGDNGIGIAGINWRVKLMALKFLDASGGGYTSDAIAALNYAVANGAKVSNNSWGGGDFSQAFLTALRNAAARGHIFVAAAGNDSSDNDTYPFYPANYNVENVVSVAATDGADKLAWFSNYGRRTVDLAAPGVGILSTLPTRQTPAMRDAGLPTEYGTLSGTSMATPHVAGVIALVQGLHPDWSVSQVVQQVLATTDAVPGAARTISGGRLNAAGAVGNPPPDDRPPRVISSDPPGNVTGTVDRVQILFSEPIDVATFTLDDIVSFTGPSGPIAVQSVAPVAGSSRQFEIRFAPQTEEGTYTLVIGPQISDLAGNLLDQDGDGTGGEDPQDRYTARFAIVGAFVFASDDVPAPIRGFTAVGSYLTINQDIPIGDLNVQVDISYHQVGSLLLILVSPGGNYAILSLFNGDGADYQNTIFDDEASTPISQGNAPFAGSYQPDDPLSVFDGENARGTWTLWVQNWGFSRLRGTLNSWSLTISMDGAAPPPGGNPSNQPPVPGDDSLSTDLDMPLVITPEQLLANDVDPDGDPLFVVSVGSATGGTVEMDDFTGVITFIPDPGYSGPAGFKYLVSDGLDTALGSVAVNIRPAFLWHNRRSPYDVNDDNQVSPIDALSVINALNTVGPGSLEFRQWTSGERMYLDVVADNFLAPIDALTVINYLNATGQGASAGSPSSASGTAAASSDGGRVQATFLLPGKDQPPLAASHRPPATASSVPLDQQPALRKTPVSPPAPPVPAPPLEVPRGPLPAPAVDAALAQVPSWLASLTGSGIGPARRLRIR
jgi:serine protease